MTEEEVIKTILDAVKKVNNENFILGFSPGYAELTLYRDNQNGSTTILGHFQEKHDLSSWEYVEKNA